MPEDTYSLEAAQRAMYRNIGQLIFYVVIPSVIIVTVINGDRSMLAVAVLYCLGRFATELSKCHGYH